MVRSQPAPAKSSPERICLYEILGIEKSATDDLIKKAYRIRALQCHPDKNPSPEAKLNFQKLVSAYNILKDSESRKLYDETGYIEGEGFDKAAEFFRTKFGRISEEDIVDFSSKYKGSDEEVQDVKNFYAKFDGDVSLLLEWVPLSEPEEVDRFIQIIDSLIAKKEISASKKYKGSIGKLRKNAAKMAKEQASFQANDENNGESMNELVLAIRDQRKRATESFLDDLVEKYTKKPKKKSKH